MNPALTFVLTFILMVSFLENLIEVDCGDGRRSHSQVAQSRWIWLPREYFSAHGIPIGAESERRQVIALPRTRSRARLFSLPLPGFHLRGYELRFLRPSAA